MPILPGFITFVIFRYWSNILQFVSLYWTERQRERYADHWLVKLSGLIDFEALESACRAFHSDSGRGQPVTHTTGRLVRALLVKYLYNASLRETEELIDNHLLIKAFVGYHLFEAPLDHSTLNRFEMWVFKHQPQLFFTEVIGLVDRLCPEDRERLQIVDTFAMKGRCAQTYLTELIRDVSRKLLKLLAVADPIRHNHLSDALDLEALFGEEGEQITAALKGQARGQRLQTVAQQALRLVRLLEHSLDQAPFLPPDEQAPLRLHLVALRKIIADECQVRATDPADPDAVIITERPHGQKGSYRIGAASDLETSYRDHGANSPTILGYNASVLGSSVFVRQTHVETGSQPDNVPLPELLQAQFEQQGFYPDQLAGDRMYGYGKVRAQVAQLTQGQTQIIALVPDYDQRSQRFNPRDFSLSDDGRSLTCPNQKTVSNAQSLTDRGGVLFRFSPNLCRACPLWDACRGPDGKKSAKRSVFISAYRAHIDEALIFNQSDTFKQGIKARMNIERLIFNLTNIHGARHAQSYGQARADYQLKMQATAFNLRQLVREMAKKKSTLASVRPAVA